MMDRLGDLHSMDFNMQFVNDVLRKLHGVFRNCLDFQSISPQLRSHNLLTDHEWQVIDKKDSREQQVDEFLKYLPHKGRHCLHQLMKCLQLSLDHSGHQDLLTELKRLVEKKTTDSIDDQIFNSGDPQESDQNDFEKVVSQFSSKINNLYLNETKVLKQKIKQQNVEIEKLELKCTDYIKTVQQLEETNEALKKQLQEKDTLLESLNNSADNFESDVLFEEVSFKSCEEETSSNERVSSSSYGYSSSPTSQIRAKRSYSEIPNQHTKLSQLSSIEDKMKAYQEKIKDYRNKCRSLEVEKQSLKDEKDQLECEVSELKQQLETVSLTSSLSHHKDLYHSGYSLYDKDLAIQANSRYESDKSAVEESSASVLSRFTSIIKNPVKRTSKLGVSSELQSTNTLVNTEITDIFLKGKDMEYENPIHKGWLIKEGGNKKVLKKRWCVLTSHFFFYFEKEEDDYKRPLGILPLTPDMEVTDSVKESCFEIFNKSGTNMKSCKLDKSRSGYVPGNHASYNLQAYCDEDKKKWIEEFEQVFEALQHS